jgi:hypothetical protein
MSPEQMQQSWQQMGALEAEMKSTGAWVFSARLHEADTATVVRAADGEILTTDDLDAALAWAAKVTRCVGEPIEVRPFVATSND